ncbi:hypothetical protein K491DRAFT_686710 [Lophiostoma macrostomum CBS 122681]|uniref:Uncharacterized protein n=1 Tax=Lophiostoma macrostomum CBS 122681 TaxID=1314788 RepID=A0A6A6TTD7_9PLEO|nr:hypothetical protein K491DRAFT_686710 [Lophiostoma macrostomum CBS 122681]
MGLPVWRAPSPEATDTLKELTAPARSPIRRRSPRRARPASRSVRLFDNDVRILDNDVVAAPRFTYAEPVSRPSSGRPRLPPPPVPESRNYARHREAGQERFAIPRESDGLHRTGYDSSLPSFGEISRSSRSLPALTPNFAPAAAARSPRRVGIVRGPPIHIGQPSDSDASEDDASDSNAVGFPPLRRMGRRTIADGPLPSSSLRESWSPGTSLDGLGDRERSVSPVDDNWDTMLSTVAPDPLAPTADSSFTSAAASASFSNSFSNSHPSSRAGSSNSNSAASSRTHLTVPSRRPSPSSELFMRQCDTSDSDTASDTEEEDLEPHLLSARRRPRQAPYSAPGRDDPPMRNPFRYPRSVQERGADAGRAVRASFADAARRRRHERRTAGTPREVPAWHPQVDGPADDPNSLDDELQTLDQDLRDARAILERLVRRDVVSDEVWASVGLPRSFADQLRERS